jgi:DNA helicase II / ATP-dependent DNA helicase PcrA
MGRTTCIDKPTVVVAGPGAGKTHGMVNEIVAAIDELKPHRHLVAITYTNAAACTICDRLFKQVPTQPNIFVGTTHAFLNRFVLQPFAAVFGELPEERIFGAIDVQSIATRGGKKKLEPAGLNKAKAAITKRLLGKGVVPYDAMLSMAERLLAKKTIRERVSRRVQFLFIDEFQDTDTRQLKLFDELRKAKHTKIYAVGDPEQYVTGFTYGTRGQKPPEFDKVPFYIFLGKSVKHEEIMNRRANGELVDFANQFRSDFQQKANKPHRGEARVFCLDVGDLELVIKEFRSLTENIECEEKVVTRLYLGFENKTFDTVRKQFGIVPVSNDSRKTPTILSDALELLSLALGISQRHARERFSLTLLEWRRLGITVLRKCQSAEFDTEMFLEFLKEHFGGVASTSRAEAIQQSLEQMKNVMVAGLQPCCSERCSSIHKAKGLEADATLIVAKTSNELKQWLTTDRNERQADKRDTCRLGYVAITRPRELLSFACLRPLDDDVRRLLADCGVTVVHPNR